MTTLIAKQLEALISQTKHPITLLSNASAFLSQSLEDTSWLGFYLYRDEQLILGPFQGLVACEEIALEKGVCGKAASTLTTQRVPDVHQFAGHIACDSRTNSEIVIPLQINQKLYGVLDIDSISFDRFSEADQLMLEECAKVIEARLTELHQRPSL